MPMLQREISVHRHLFLLVASMFYTKVPIDLSIYLSILSTYLYFLLDFLFSQGSPTDLLILLMIKCRILKIFCRLVMRVPNVKATRLLFQKKYENKQMLKYLLTLPLISAKEGSNNTEWKRTDSLTDNWIINCQSKRLMMGR